MQSRKQLWAVPCRQPRGLSKSVNPFGVTANGAPIDDYNFRPTAATISYTLAFEQEQARVYAGMSAAEYDALPGTPMWIDPEKGGRSKCHVLVLYRMSQYIPAVGQDAQARKLEADAKRRGRH